MSNDNLFKLPHDELMVLKMPAIREYAAQRGYGTSFGEKKADFVARIVELQEMTQPSPKKEEVPAEAKDEKLRTKPPAKNVTQAEIKKACKLYTDKGMFLDFPAKDQFYMRFKKKEECGNIRTSLRTIVQRADILCR